MNGTKLAAVILIVGGILGLAYGGFSYTKETHSTDIGSLHLQVKETERVNIPLWVGVGAIVGGVLVLTMGRRT
jgi:uncharacterized membrane protein YidH (DUF202 family)